MIRRLVITTALAAALGLSAVVAQAQPAPLGKLIITVVDPSRLVVPGATVTVVGLDDATRKTSIAPAKSNDKGLVTIDALPLGRYSVHGEFPGFELGTIRELRLKAGDNRHVLLLPLAKMTEEITVGRDKQVVASERGASFGSALTREQIDALSDDPDEMAKQLQDMAGPGATIRVDSFEGSQLPPKAQIKAIHITRDMFAAENHSAGGMFVDIITQPGLGVLRGGLRYGFYDSTLDGRNPLIPKKGPARNQNLGLNLSGTIVKDKSSFNLSADGWHSYSTPSVYAATTGGTVAENLNLRVLNDNYRFGGSFDYALTPDQTLRVAVSHNWTKARNLGVGAYDLIERAYASNSNATNLRIQEAGPIGRRFFINTRLMLNWNNSATTSSLEAPTIMVNDAFTSGGGQRAGGRHTRTIMLQSDLDYVKGIHSWRTGITVDGGQYRSNDTSNYLGTYTFESLAAYQAGLPRTYTRRIGDPNINYSNYQIGWYVQDDIRVSKTLTLSPGVRIEAQTHLADRNNVGPRFGITWAPFKNGKTTFRASVGRFYDWLGSGIYEQTLRVDGFRQQELNILNPSYPETGSLGLVPATNRYELGGDLRMANNTRTSLGVDQQINKVLRVNALYADTWSNGLLVGNNLNGPVGGIRPNPVFANLIETVSAGKARSTMLSTTLMLNLTPQGRIPGMDMAGAFFSWRRGLMIYGGYTLSSSRNNVDGAFTVPASGRLDTEWGPSNFDARHRVYMMLSSSAVKNLSINLTINGGSGSPYTIRTGRDDNGDLMFNDRPAGVGRNTLRGAGAWNSSGMFSYTISFGKKSLPGGGMGGMMIMGGAGGVVSMMSSSMGAMARYRLTLQLSVNNLANHANYVGYNGNMLSPLFGKPTSVQGVRSFNLGANFSF
jgi:hypothetical protein